MEEEWRWVIGFEGKYQISNYGKVKSFLQGKPKIRKCGYLNNGYPYYVLKKPDGTIKGLMAHTMVMASFVGPRPEGLVIRHLDGDRNNPKLSNLKYGTYEENEADKKLHNRVARYWLGKQRPDMTGENHISKIFPESIIKGEAHYRAVLSEEDVYNILDIWSNKLASCVELNKYFNVDKGNILHIVKRKSWKSIKYPNPERHKELIRNQKLILDSIKNRFRISVIKFISKERILSILSFSALGFKIMDISRTFNLPRKSVSKIIKDYSKC